ncbi:hypothetical protein [Clostridium beijerinckii]|uniref:hypothetical protein n=1 Tax=Clostridium beijerinckii TaxID=1520 RepID=UPI00156F6638|nr:hypothetical protein [Clostridium beijerinckii]NSA58524.1 hypothetical protein [Clostridium beijerinckii]
MNKSYINLLKKNVEDNNYEESIKTLLNMYKEDKINFRKKNYFQKYYVLLQKLLAMIAKTMKSCRNYMQND